MPNIIVELLEGRTAEDKKRLVAEITRAAVEALPCDPQTVNIRIYELSRDSVARGGRMLSDQ